MYKLLSSATDHYCLSTGYAREKIDRSRESIVAIKVNGKFQSKIFLNDVFGVAEHQQKTKFGLSDILT